MSKNTTQIDLSAAQEFPAGSFLALPKKVPHFALCKGETIESDYWDAATLMKQVGVLPSR